MSSAYKRLFQVSGTPVRHQWLQSMPRCPPLPYVDGCASFRSQDSAVTLSKPTGFDMLLNTLSTISSAGCRLLGYGGTVSGRVSVLQFFPSGYPQSLELFISTTTTSIISSVTTIYIRTNVDTLYRV